MTRSSGGERPRQAAVGTIISKRPSLLQVREELGRLLEAPLLDMEKLRALYQSLDAVVAMKERRRSDDYQTDPRLIDAFFQKDYLYSFPERVLDIGAGTGGWGNGLAHYCARHKLDLPMQHGVDIQKDLMPPGIYGRRFHMSFLDPMLKLPYDPAASGPGYTHIGWNFPYGNADHRDLITAFLFRAYTFLPLKGPGEIWTLSRLNWLSSQDRAATIFGHSNPAREPWKEDIVILATRPTFYYPVPAVNGLVGGTLEDAYGGRTYPTDFVMVRFAFEDRRPVGTKSIMDRLVYDKRAKMPF